MKTMNNFAAQQLTKTQMNKITGGRVLVGCTIRDQNGELVEMLHVESGDTFEEAMMNMFDSLGDNNAFNCVVHRD